MGADTVIPFKSGGSLDISSIIYNFNCGLSISATPKTDGIAIGYACGYNGNAEYYKGPATLSGATNVKALYDSGQVTGHSTPVYLFIGECKAGTPVSMSVASNGGAWTGGSVAVFIIPKA